MLTKDPKDQKKISTCIWASAVVLTPSPKRFSYIIFVGCKKNSKKKKTNSKISSSKTAQLSIKGRIVHNV